MKPRLSPRQRIFGIVLVASLCVGAGVLVATQIDFTMWGKSRASPDPMLLLREVTLGTLASPGEATKTTPKLRQASSYRVNDPLALRITMDPAVTEPVTLVARLLTPTGQVVELEPSSVTFRPGTSTHCCWQVAQGNDYTLQVFYLDRVITALPLRIDAPFTR
ncbi:MAG: hypothetical protein WEA04_02870 [Candidatus Andersenbacteria bacterium]